jgi:hypothetical protein
MIHETISIREHMVRLLTANTSQGGHLLERHGMDKEVDLIVTKGGVCAMLTAGQF